MLGDTDMTEAAAHVALHDDRETVIYDAVVTARRAVGAARAMAAVANDAGSYEMRVSHFVRESRFREMVIRRGLGGGGQVLAEGRSRCVDDYATESTISADFKPIVALEDLHGIGGTLEDGRPYVARARGPGAARRGLLEPPDSRAAVDRGDHREGLRQQPARQARSEVTAAGVVRATEHALQ
jgi:hypothetical protein